MAGYREFAVKVAKEAGKILMANYGNIKSLDYNTRTHFKTKVDDLSDQLIRKRIEDAGGEGLKPLTPDAVKRIFDLSGGFPREIIKIY